MHEEHRGSYFDPDNDRPSTPPAPRRSILPGLFIGLVMVGVLLVLLLPAIQSPRVTPQTQSAAQRWQDRAQLVEAAARAASVPRESSSH